MAKKKNYKSHIVNRRKQLTNSEFIIYTDGGCLVNPGGVGGYGAVILPQHESSPVELYGAYEPTTNNRMELMAVIKALEALPKSWESVRVYSDSQYVVYTAEGLWHGNKNKDLWEKYRKIVSGKKIECRWIKGHNGDRWNERCDELALKAMHFSSPEKDIGYGRKDPAACQYKERAYSYDADCKQLDIPAEYCGIWRFSTAEEFINNGVFKECAESLAAIRNMDNPTFKIYASLKTGGIDLWSRKDSLFLLKAFGTEIWNILNRNLESNEKDILTALRWYGRGLPLDMAVRKVLVGNMIAGNSGQSKREKGVYGYKRT